MKHYLTTIVCNWLCERGEPGVRCEAARLGKDGLYYPVGE